MFIRAKYVLQFSRRDDIQNTGFNPANENRRINCLDLYFAEAVRGKAEESI